MRKLIILFFTSVSMLFGASAYADEITVYMTVEKLTLGQGFIVEPLAVQTGEGSTVAQVLEEVMSGEYTFNGSIEENLYVKSFYDIEDELNIPEWLSELVGDVTERADSEWLSEFDYSNAAGWKYSVNNEFPPVSASEAVLNDGDVVRWQFSLYGYGTDLEMGDNADKSDLIRSVANGNYSDYAMEVLTSLTASNDEVSDACNELALENDYFEDNSGYAGANLNLTAEYIKTAVKEPTISSIGGEWAVIGLARSGTDIDKSYFDGYLKKVIETLKKNNGIIHDRKYTEYARVAIALASIGKNPSNIYGYDLISPLTDFDTVMRQGTNGAIFSLIAMDSCNYVSDVREKYIEEILSRQCADGAFSLSKNGESDVDITAMALCALSKYTERPTVRNAVDKAVAYLSEIQMSDGGFASYGEGNCESAVQVIIGLTSLGIGLDDERFVKNGNSVTDYVLSYAVDNGGFKHTKDGEVNLMATEQALCALAAVNRSDKTLTSLYDMSDMQIAEITGPRRGKQEDVFEKMLFMAKKIG